jgi:hypothetical protein
MRCYFVKYLQDGFTSTHARDDMTMQSTKFPIYFVHAGTKPLFLTKKGHPKSVIPCSVTMRCFFLSGWMRLYRGKIFARWVYNNTIARDDTTMRWFFLRMDAFGSL